MFGDGRLRVPSTSSLAGWDPSSIHRDFLKNFGKPRAAGAADGSLKRLWLLSLPK